MRIHILGAQRRKPRIGDRRVTKKHGLQIRVVVTHNGMWVTTGRSYCYEWQTPAQLLCTRWEYLIKPEERAAIKPDGTYCRLADKPRQLQSIQG